MKPAHHPAPEWMSVPWAWWNGLLALPAWLAIQFAIGIGLSFLAPYWHPLATFINSASAGNSLQAQVGAYALEVLAGVLVIGYYLKKYKVGLGAVGWHKFSVIRMIAYLLGMFLVFYVGVNLLLDLVTVLVPGFNANQAQNNGIITTAHQAPNLALFALVVVPPILEETLFRGLIFESLSKKWGVVWGAIASSALFGLAHMQANIGVYTFALGLVLCFLYVRMKSIIPGMFLHMLNNYIAFMMIYHK